MKLGVTTILIAAAILATVQSNQVNIQSEDDVVTIATEAAVDQTECVTEPTHVEVEEPHSTESLEETVPETQEAVKHYTNEDIIMIAKVMWAECRGVPSDTEKACVAWTILNRVDADDSKTIAGVIKAKNQFAWDSSFPVDDDLYALAEDVLIRWNREKNGETDVGRVLPSEYTYFSGRNGHNYFRDKYKGGNTWDYSLPSPYDT